MATARACITPPTISTTRRSCSAPLTGSSWLRTRWPPEAVHRHLNRRRPSEGQASLARLLEGCGSAAGGWVDRPLRARGDLTFNPEAEKIMPIVNRVADLQPDIQAWRRDIHEHPELLYDVHRTAAFVAERVRGFGCGGGAGPAARGRRTQARQAGRQGRRQCGPAPRRYGCAADRGGHRSALCLEN